MVVARQILGIDRLADDGSDRGRIELDGPARVKGPLVESGGDRVIGRSRHCIVQLRPGLKGHGTVYGERGQEDQDEDGGRHQRQHAAAIAQPHDETPPSPERKGSTISLWVLETVSPSPSRPSNGN